MIMARRGPVDRRARSSLGVRRVREDGHDEEGSRFGSRRYGHWEGMGSEKSAQTTDIRQHVGRLAEPARDAVEKSVSRTPTVFSGETIFMLTLGTRITPWGYYPRHQSGRPSRGLKQRVAEAEDTVALGRASRGRSHDVDSRP